MIGQETLDRVRRDANIVEVVSESVKLQKRGYVEVDCDYRDAAAQRRLLRPASFARVA